MQIASVSPAALSTTSEQRERQLWKAAQKLEATFLAEMLKYTGMDGTAGSFSGGIGEDQFKSFLRQEQADLLVQRGGIGLAQSLFEALKEQDDALSE